MAIDVSGIDKAELLAALYNGSAPHGMGMLHGRPGKMTREEAGIAIGGKSRVYFDYLHGRPLKVEINGSTLDGRLYDRDAGHGAAQRIVDRLRGTAP